MAEQPEHDGPSHFRVLLPSTGSELHLGDIFILVYERFEGLSKNGHDEEADKMDKSLNVAALTEIAGGQIWKPFDTIWSAREFRETLYHAIAPKLGGPL